MDEWLRSLEKRLFAPGEEYFVGEDYFLNLQSICFSNQGKGFISLMFAFLLTYFIFHSM